jgi:hypothetical protein
LIEQWLEQVEGAFIDQRDLDIGPPERTGSPQTAKTTSNVKGGPKVSHMAA